MIAKQIAPSELGASSGLVSEDTLRAMIER